MQANVKLGRIFGIPVGLHVSWFLIFGLVTWSLALGYFPAEYPALSPITYWLLGALTSILFYGSDLVLGMISREHVLRYIRIRSELKV